MTEFLTVEDSLQLAAGFFNSFKWDNSAALMGSWYAGAAATGGFIEMIFVAYMEDALCR